MLNKSNFAIARFVDDNNSSPGLHVTPDGTTVTNGKLLVHVTAAPAEALTIPGIRHTEVFRPFLLAPTDALQLAAGVPLVFDNVFIDRSSEGPRARFGVSDLSHVQVFEFLKALGTFPDWQMILPSSSLGVNIQLNLRQLIPLLASMLTFLQPSSGRSALATFTIGTTTPLKVEASNDRGQTMTIVLAPWQ